MEVFFSKGKEGARFQREREGAFKEVLFSDSEGKDAQPPSILPSTLLHKPHAPANTAPMGISAARKAACACAACGGACVPVSLVRSAPTSTQMYSMQDACQCVCPQALACCGQRVRALHACVQHTARAECRAMSGAMHSQHLHTLPTQHQGGLSEREVACACAVHSQALTTCTRNGSHAQ
jgi:hypothetical protein